jgi:hypothetical protein
MLVVLWYLRYGRSYRDVEELLAERNIIVDQATLDHLVANGHYPDPTDVARLSPLSHPTINLNGHYQTTNNPSTSGLRALRTPR